MNGVQTRFKCKLDVKRCKRFVFPPSSLLPRSNALKTKAIRYFQTDRTLTRIVSPPLLAARIGEVEKAYQLFLHATRLDLDDYNNETHQGLHITSMPGSWLAIVRGFAGMQILEGILSFFPVIPEKWNSYSFQINYQGRTLHMHVGKEINISLIAGEELNIQVYKNVYKLKLGTDLLLRIEE